MGRQRSEWFTRAGSNARWGVVAFSIDGGLVLIYTVLLARILGPDTLGIFAACLGSVVVAYLVMDFGTSLFVSRSVARGEMERGTLRALWRIRAQLGIGVIAFTVVLWRSGVSIVFRDGSIIALAIAEGLAAITALNVAVLRGSGRFKHVAGVVAIDRMLFLGLIVVGWRLGWVGQGLALGAAVGLVVSRGAGLCAAMLACRGLVSALPEGKSGYAAGINAYRKSAGLGSFVVVERGVVSILPLGLATFSGPGSAGVFHACMKVAMAPISIVSAVAGALYPTLSTASQARSGEVREVVSLATRSTLLLTGSTASLMLGMPSMVLAAAFGHDYVAAGTHTMMLLGPYVMLAGLWQLGLYLLCASGLEVKALQTSIGSGLVTLGIALSLASAIGPMSGAIGLVAGAVCGLLVYSREVRRLVDLGTWRVIWSLPILGLVGSTVLLRAMVPMIKGGVPAVAVVGAAIAALWMGVGLWTGYLHPLRLGDVFTRATRLAPLAARGRAGARELRGEDETIRQVGSESND